MKKIELKDVKKLILQEVQKSRLRVLLESPEMLDEKSILKNKYPFKAIYIFGPAGSGKSYIAGNLLGIPTDFVVSNPDDRIEEVFPAFGISMKFANSEDGGNADLETLQQHSRTILQNANRAHTSNLISIANPLTFDTTGEKVPKMVKRIEALTNLGYDIAVFMVNVPTQASVDRDARRKRNVGAERTADISQKYQQDVVKSQGYLKALASNKHVTVLSGVYNNIFDLNTGELLTKPTVITPDMLPDDLNPEKNPEAFAAEKAKMEQAVSKLQQWVNTPVENPAGQAVLNGMRTLVKKSGGRLGQNLNDLVIATAKEELRDPDVIAAAEHLSALGGGEKAVSGAVRGKKDTGDDSIRGMTQKESLNYDGLVDFVRDALFTNGDG